MRLSPNHISIADPGALPAVYGRGPTALPKSPFYSAFVDADHPSIFSAIDPALHAHKTRLISSAFSTRALASFVPMIQATIGTWIERLDGLAAAGGEVSMLDWLHFLGASCCTALAVIR